MPKRQNSNHESLDSIPPPAKSNSFFRNFLETVHYLQKVEGFRGVSAPDIECFMCRHYPVDGDIKSQVKWATNTAISCGFLQEQDCKFHLIYAMARIYLAMEEKEKAKEICYAKHLFKSTWKCCGCCPPPPKCPLPCPMPPPCPIPPSCPVPMPICPQPCPAKRSRSQDDSDSSKSKTPPKKECKRLKRCTCKSAKAKSNCSGERCCGGRSK